MFGLLVGRVGEGTSFEAGATEAMTTAGATTLLTKGTTIGCCVDTMVFGCVLLVEVFTIFCAT
jgi:hypothetical protein